MCSLTVQATCISVADDLVTSRQDQHQRELIETSSDNLFEKPLTSRPIIPNTNILSVAMHKPHLFCINILSFSTGDTASK